MEEQERADAPSGMDARTMTATSALPGAFWNAGPLFTSHTSPTPMMPLRCMDLLTDWIHSIER